MTRENKRINIKKAEEKRIRRDHADKVLEFAATNKIKPVLKEMNTTLRGLSEKSRTGKQIRTRKKQSYP